VLEVFLQIVRPVAHMHACTPPIAHRDLKVRPRDEARPAWRAPPPRRELTPAPPPTPPTPPLPSRNAPAQFENVLIAADGSLRLCDFGSASTHEGVCDTKADRLDQEDFILRYTTPNFRAPEMCDLYNGQPLDTRR
jgi:serine/threonine protein kinase